MVAADGLVPNLGNKPLLEPVLKKFSDPALQYH